MQRARGLCGAAHQLSEEANMHVHRRIRTTILTFSFVSILGGSSVALGQSQAGGLPVVSDRVSALEKTAATLQGAVASLQTSVQTLQTQVTVLQNSNTALENDLNAERAARTAADTSLQKALSQEAAARADGEAFLESALNLESVARINADNAFASQINTRGKAFATRVERTFLVNGQRATVAQLPLPAGSYFVLAKAVLRNQDHDSHW